MELTNDYLYKNKKFIKKLNSLNNEELNIFFNTKFISTLSIDVINYIFRNSSSIVQNKLWENDTIQKILILGTKDETNYEVTEKTIRNLENLNKVIKSPSIKKQIYNNKYFIHIIIYGHLTRSFFHSYYIKKIFEGMILSDEFNSLSPEQQLIKISKLNSHSEEILLPEDFRKRYKNIDRVLLNTNRDNIDTSILEQLNENELFFLEYLNKSLDNKTLKSYLLKQLKDNAKSFEEFFIDIKSKETLIREKIKYYDKEYYYNNITLSEKIYHILLNEIEDELIKEKLLKYLLIKITKDININPELIYNTLKRNLNNKLLTCKDIFKLITTYYQNIEFKELKILFYIKFNIALSNTGYLYGISKEQLSKINVKHINKLFKLLNDKTQDELSAIYGVCIKMYLIFGYERSLEILDGKYGEYNKIFLDNVAKTNVTRVKMIEEGNKYIPSIDKRFINFMFETPKNNHFIEMLKKKHSYLYKLWYKLYNNYDEILEKCHNEITLKKINTILETEQYDINRNLITPDNYQLNNNDFIENIVLGNKTHISNNEVLEKIIEIYTNMKQRVESSIPYIEGISSNGYRYQMLKFDDKQIFELGYKANCCIRVFDIAHNHLLHAALCRNGRILLIYDKMNDLKAFIPLKRNGNVLIANSIECVDKNLNTVGNLITDTFNEAINDIVNITKNSNEPIELVCIGRKSYLKPNAIPFPNELITPTIYEKNDEVYSKTDTYHKELDIVYKDNYFDLKNIKTKDPNVSYMDPRDEIKYLEYNYRSLENIDEVLNIINSINYTKNKENYNPISKYMIKKVYYSKDWYIIDTHYGIIGEYLEYDYRAKEEYDYYMSKLINNNEVKILTKTIRD